MDKDAALRGVKSALIESDITNPNEYSFKSIKEGMIHIEKRIEDFDITLRRLLIIFDDDPKNESRKGLISLVHSHDDQIKTLQNTLLLKTQVEKDLRQETRLKLAEKDISELKVLNRMFKSNIKQWVIFAMGIGGLLNMVFQLYLKKG